MGMKAEIKEGKWLMVDGPVGTEWVPVSDLSRKEMAEAATLQQKAEASGRCVKITGLRRHLENPEAWAIDLQDGFGARMALKGQKDEATDWVVFETRQDAEQYLDQYYGDEPEEEFHEGD